MGKTFIADKETLDKIYDIVATEEVYGFIEHNATLAPGSRIEYIGVNKSWNPISITMGGGYSLGSWANFPWLKANKPWMVHSDGRPDYRLCETDYTKKEDGETASDVANTSYDGGAFAWAQKIYKQEYMAGDDRYVLFSMTEREGFEPVGFKDGSDNVLEGVWIPMFYGSIVNDGTNDVMRSLSGLQPECSHTTAQQKAAIDYVGTRARFFGGPIINTLVDLMIMLAKTTQLQGFYGQGNCNGYKNDAQLYYGVLENAVVGGGQFYGTTDKKSLNKIFHSIVLGSYNLTLRDPYTLCVNGRFKVSRNYAYALDASGYFDTGIDVPAPDSNGWAYPHKYKTVPGFGHLPVPPYGGSTSTGGCDGLYRSASQASITAVARRFGACGYDANDGGRYMILNNAATSTDWYIGSALLLLPPVGVAA